MLSHHRKYHNLKGQAGCSATTTRQQLFVYKLHYFPQEMHSDVNMHLYSEFLQCIHGYLNHFGLEVVQITRLRGLAV